MAAAGIGVVLAGAPDGKVNQPESRPVLSCLPPCRRTLSLYSCLVDGSTSRSHETKDSERTRCVWGICVLLESEVFIGTQLIKHKHAKSEWLELACVQLDL